MIVIAGYFLALMMGLTLGLIGAGGSILTVPIFVYLLHVKPVTATAYSLLVVGCTALLGSISYWKRGAVYLKEALFFALPSMSAVWLTRVLILPSIPPMVGPYSKDSIIMVLFALLMIAASVFIFNAKAINNKYVSMPININNALRLILGSGLVGLTTGMVGAGGGFLIVPSLVALFGLPIKEAIGTSLTIIAINSFAGFSGDMINSVQYDWVLLGMFITMTLSGVFLGAILGYRMHGKNLKSFFAIFTFIVGILILGHELTK